MIEDIDLNDANALFAKANELKEAGSFGEALNYYSEAALHSHDGAMRSICEMFFSGYIKYNTNLIADYLSFIDSKNNLFDGSVFSDYVNYYLLTLSSDDLNFLCAKCKEAGSIHL